MSIIAEQIEVERQGRAVVRELSLRIDAGEIVSIVGPNGAGKSSLLLALAGVLPTARGRVRLDERPITSFSRREIARRIAYVPQSDAGFPGFQVRQVLESARFAHVHPLAPAGAHDWRLIEQEIEACGLSGLEMREIGALSAGERQKVSLAAALVQEAEYLLLDEPTAALDPKYIVRIVELLRARQARGRGIVLVCHDLNVPAALGGRVLALRAGRAQFVGPIADFLRPERLEATFETGFRVITGEGGRPFVYPVC